ncbi:putative addiction module component, TIGR02574 family [Marinospirillum celere]|uniref:Putative addiction module component, TIGR02574 family n=1 Tax=Marinospirillum celere TaxID=1122252 RepID=A0A1I1ELL0_9GAMM|nr:addiction module protein [Marinospirillum celere]SFB87984.1 putative addiction module component, TIGR02574 family [Marinospirillum celere]
MDVSELIREVELLPVEERAKVAESVLQSLNPPEPEIDQQWAAVARQRLEEVRSGSVQTLPGEEVFARIWKSLEK